MGASWSTPTTAVGGLLKKSGVKDQVDGYEKYHSHFGGNVEARKKAYADMVNKYYDLATSFYEYGWGTSFHFAHRFRGETHEESIKRHEHFLALKLGLGSGMKVLDVGCGVGGPMRQIAGFSGATVTGLNNNAYQISRGEIHNKREGVKTCSFVKADFMNIPVKDGHYDAVYEIDATCHAPDALACYKEIARVLKPGGLFGGYEWCLTDHYEAHNPKHIVAKEEIEIGNGLPEVRTTKAVIAALKLAGFDVLEYADLAEPQPHKTADSQLPWWEPLDGQGRFMSLTNFRTSWLGRLLTRNLVWWLELLRLAPRGSCQVSNFLEKGADGLCAGGRMGIFTPIFFFVARKKA